MPIGIYELSEFDEKYPNKPEQITHVTTTLEKLDPMFLEKYRFFCQDSNFKF